MSGSRAHPLGRPRSTALGSAALLSQRHPLRSPGPVSPWIPPVATCDLKQTLTGHFLCSSREGPGTADGHLPRLPSSSSPLPPALTAAQCTLSRPLWPIPPPSPGDPAERAAPPGPGDPAERAVATCGDLMKGQRCRPWPSPPVLTPTRLSPSALWGRTRHGGAEGHGP